MTKEGRQEANLDFKVKVSSAFPELPAPLMVAEDIMESYMNAGNSVQQRQLVDLARANLDAGYYDLDDSAADDLLRVELIFMKIALSEAELGLDGAASPEELRSYLHEDLLPRLVEKGADLD